MERNEKRERGRKHTDKARDERDKRGKTLPRSKLRQLSIVGINTIGPFGWFATANSICSKYRCVQKKWVHFFVAVTKKDKKTPLL